MTVTAIGHSGFAIETGDVTLVFDYYIDPANTALKDGYRSFLAKIFTLAGLDRPAVRASNAVSVEDAQMILLYYVRRGPKEEKRDDRGAR